MFMFRSVIFVFALVVGILAAPCGAQIDKAVPKELAQYVRDAQKAGLKAPQIRENALKAGWEEALVDDVLASVQASPSPDAPVKVVDMDAKDPAPVPEAAAAAAPRVQPAGPAPSESAPPASPAPAPEAAGSPAGTVKPQVPEGGHADDYLIGEGDVLQVAVWGEPTASVLSATVRPDGKISMPLIKDVMVAGQTPAQVEKVVQEQLGKIIRAADVTVIVAQINSKKIFLVGAVKREGPLKYTYRMTVLQAISEAGGLTDYAKRKDIYVLHTESGRQYRLPFNYNAVLKGEHMEQNILLSPGDTIVVR
jgi:polysaccharide export outer membrane protein